MILIQISSLLGGYIAVDSHREYAGITDDEAPWILICFAIIFIYFVLKQFDNKFVNKYENIILPVIFIVIPIILAIAFTVFNS